MSRPTKDFNKNLELDIRFQIIRLKIDDKAITGNRFRNIEINSVDQKLTSNMTSHGCSNK